MPSDEYEIGEVDERDEEDRLREPQPTPRTSPFRDPNEDYFSRPDILSAPPTGLLVLTVINRALPNEGVPTCKVSIASLQATTNNAGNTTLDITPLVDGQYALTALAPDVSEDPVGPGFPIDIAKERIWRPFRGKIWLQGGRVTGVEPEEWLKINGARINVHLQPVWMRSSVLSSRSKAPDMVVIHHTAGSLQSDLNTFLYGGEVSVHYLVAPNGEIYKLVDESKTAFHAGTSSWQGADAMNSRSIGIEITHKTGVEYPVAQIDGVVDLVSLLKRAYPEIPAGRVVGHSDIGLCDPNSSKPCSPREPRRLGRKSTDPGSAFPWERIEALGLSFQIADGVVNPEMYGGFFQMVPGGKLHSGDSDHQHRYGGQIRPSIRGAVQWLQKDLEKIGYFCPPDGDYGIQTAMAVQMFQQHIFSGSRRTGAPDHFNSGDGSLDMRTAELIKRVLNEVELTTGA